MALAGDGRGRHGGVRSGVSLRPQVLHRGPGAGADPGTDERCHHLAGGQKIIPEIEVERIKAQPSSDNKSLEIWAYIHNLAGLELAPGGTSPQVKIYLFLIFLVKKLTYHYFHL